MLTWEAVYNDGKTFLQYNADGTENQYEAIDRAQLTQFNLYDGNHAVYALYLRDGQRLIYRRRNFIKLMASANGEAPKEERHLIYLIGWQMTILTSNGPKNITALNYILEDGSVILDNERSNLQLLPEET